METSFRCIGEDNPDARCLAIGYQNQWVSISGVVNTGNGNLANCYETGFMPLTTPVSFSYGILGIVISPEDADYGNECASVSISGYGDITHALCNLWHCGVSGVTITAHVIAIGY